MRLSRAPFLALPFVALALASIRVPDEASVRLLDLAASRGRAIAERCEIARDSREASVLRAGEEFVGGKGERLAAPLTLLSREAAEAPVVYAPLCTGAPAAFVWHAGNRPAPAPVDPDIARRLRALGYLP